LSKGQSVMKQLLLGSVAALALSAAGAANAADLPVKAPPPAAPPSVWSWTGFYIGGYIGGAQEYSSLDDPLGSVSYGDHVTSPGFIAGGQIGANYQFGNVVLGAEADLSWANVLGHETCFGLTGGLFYSSDCSAHPTSLGTLTGRVGYAFGRTLLYAKGGAAWEQNNVDMAVNRNPGNNFLTSANSYGEWGWTLGAGTEYALTPAWSLFAEYDYAGFASESVATPYVAGNPLHQIAPVAGWSNNIQVFKLGINYKIGADPTLWPSGALTPPLWVTPAIGSLPVKAPRPAASGWEIEGGARYMYSLERTYAALGAQAPNGSIWYNGSKVTWANQATNSAELFGRVDSPSNVFVSGFVGVGDTISGSQTDEDFDEPTPHRPYTGTASTSDGHINYAVADLGYDVVRTADYKIGPFVGYTVLNQYIFTSGCQQFANPIGNCAVPLPNSQLIGLDSLTWQAMRVGLSAEVKLADRLKLTADVAYLPYVTVDLFDNHLGENGEGDTRGQGIGVQLQAVLSYDVTDRLTVGIGARYWAMWTTSGELQMIAPTGPSGPLAPTLTSVQLAGVFAQLGYRFDPDMTTAAKPAGLALPFLKAPAAPAAYNWTGFYAGIEGGEVWGQSIQIGQTPGRDTFDATPWFDVSGGMIGGTVGYNAQFARIFVFGLEGDMSWVDARGSARQIALGTSLTASTTEDWLATARARIGVTPVDHWLVYATGGLAMADVEATIPPSAGSSSTEALGSESHVRPGWTVGGGVEASITRNWSAKIEYLYVGLENHAYFVPTPANPLVDNRAGGVPLNNNIVRAGINYKFGSL
jgi:opacity protein-like surface antigen